MKHANNCNQLTLLANILWHVKVSFIKARVQLRATENGFFAALDRFLVCKTDSFCIKHIFFGSKKHTLWIIYWLSYLDWSSVKPVIVRNYSNNQCCQHIRPDFFYLLIYERASPEDFSPSRKIKLLFWILLFFICRPIIFLG